MYCVRLKKELVGPLWLRFVDTVAQVSRRIPFFAALAVESQPSFMSLNTNPARPLYPSVEP